GCREAARSRPSNLPAEGMAWAHLARLPPQTRRRTVPTQPSRRCGRLLPAPRPLVAQRPGPLAEPLPAGELPAIFPGQTVPPVAGGGRDVAWYVLATGRGAAAEPGMGSLCRSGLGSMNCGS